MLSLLSVRITSRVPTRIRPKRPSRSPTDSVLAAAAASSRAGENPRVCAPWRLPGASQLLYAPGTRYTGMDRECQRFDTLSMYKKYFGLQANPFNPNPDPRFLFLTAAMREALAGLAYGIKNRKGFLL